MADNLLDALTEGATDPNEEVENNVLIINPEDRTIRIPKGFVFGVYNDKDVLTIPFSIPRYYGENDLSDFAFTINYINAAGLGNIYDIVDLDVGRDTITFTWTLGRAVFVSKGFVRFIVCIRRIGENGRILKELNTRIYTAEVLAGLEVEETVDPEAYSILANMVQLEASTRSLSTYVAVQASKITTIAGTVSNDATRAETAASEAEDSVDAVEAEALKAEGFALGTQNGSEVDEESPYYHANAKYFSEITEVVPMTSNEILTILANATDGLVIEYDTEFVSKSEALSILTGEGG